MKKYIITFLILLLLPTISISAAEKTISQWEKELNKVQKELDETNQQKQQTQSEINSANNKINSIYNEMEEINKEVENKTRESEQLEKDIEKKNQETKELMRYYQISSSGSAMLEYIMGAESITDLIYRLSITEQISNYNKKLVEDMNKTIAENEQIKKDLAIKKEELTKLKSDLNNEVATLNKTKESLDEEGHSLSESISEMKKTISDLKKMGCKSNETPTACQKRIYGNSGGYLPSGSTFYRPTKSGKISSEYGWRTLYGKPNNHAAIDISTPIGTTVYSVAPGRVAKVIYSNSGGGNQIIIHHQINGKYYTSYYCHLNSIAVQSGTIVTSNTVIGASGNTGNSTGPHLHLGLANGRWYTDYYSYYGNSGFIGHSFNPRNVIIFPAKGSSYYNR